MISGQSLACEDKIDKIKIILSSLEAEYKFKELKRGGEKVGSTLRYNKKRIKNGECPAGFKVFVLQPF